MGSLAADLFRTKTQKADFKTEVKAQCLSHQKEAYSLNLHVSVVEATKSQK